MQNMENIRSYFVSLYFSFFPSVFVFFSLIFFPLFTPFPSLSRSIDVFSFKRMYGRAIVGTRLGFSREIEFERRSDYHGRQVQKWTDESDTRSGKPMRDRRADLIIRCCAIISHYIYHMLSITFDFSLWQFFVLLILLSMILSTMCERLSLLSIIYW